MSAGIGWKDSAGNKLVIEYSTEVPPTAASTWNAIAEWKGGSANPEEANTDDFTNYDSDDVDERAGLRRLGTHEFTHNFVPTDAGQAAIIALSASQEARWFRKTYPKSVTTNSTAASEMWAGQVSQASISPPDPSGGANPPVELAWTSKVNSDYTFTAESA